jgi:hypothetical protein
VSPIKCPSCEYRNFHPGDTCINCGAPLSSQAPAERPPSPKNRPSPRNRPLPREEHILDSRPLPKEEPFSTNKPLSRKEPSPTNRPLPRKMASSTTRPISKEDPLPTNKPLPRDMPTLDSRPLPTKKRIPRNRSYSKTETDGECEPDPQGGPYLEDERYCEHESDPRNDPYLVEQSYPEDGSDSEDGPDSRELVPYQQNLPANYGLLPSPNTALEPYQINTAMQEYLPSSLLPDLSTFVKEDKQARLKPWETDKLPWGLPRRDPDVEGTIIQIQQSQELPDYPNLVVGIVNMLTELIWLIPNDTMKKEEERLQITTVRIRTSNDEKRDARLIGYLRGANLTLGDDVWFWGWHRQGSLTVRKGYNWTSKAIINTHSMGLVVPALILLILVGIGFLLFLAGPSLAAGLRILR